MQSGKKPLPEPPLTQIYIAIWCHQATTLSKVWTLKSVPRNLVCVSVLVFDLCYPNLLPGFRWSTQQFYRLVSPLNDMFLFSRRWNYSTKTIPRTKLHAHVCSYTAMPPSAGSVLTTELDLSLAQSKLRLCSANHRAGYWSPDGVPVSAAKNDLIILSLITFLYSYSKRDSSEILRHFEHLKNSYKNHILVQQELHFMGCWKGRLQTY